jgi:LysM repeat protein
MKCLLAILLCIPFALAAQQKQLQIEGVMPGLYLTHTVAAKENYYSIGRLYNISPKEIAPFNNLVLENGLSLHQTIKIPLTPGNFVQSNTAAADEALVPVYYTIKEKEGLYRVSTNFNKVPVESIKEWNNIKGDALGNGSKLIVGYLKVKKELSALAAGAKQVAPAAKQETTKTAVVNEVKPDISNETLPVVKNPAKQNTVEVKPAEVQKETADKPVVVPVVKKETVVTRRESKNFNGGFFKPAYEQQSRNASMSSEMGNGAIFKSTSGWEDGKYYCLHNTAAPGTIIKVTANNKSIYAKVLDLLPDISQNNGLLIRLSNAAAAELGLGETKFDCTVNYFK